MTSYLDASDGRWHHRFRQSHIKTALEICPERGRLELLGKMPDKTTDAAAIGTAVHAGIETVLLQVMDGWEPDEEMGLFEAQAEFITLSRGPDFEYVKIKTEATALQKVERCFRNWYRNVLPNLQPLAVEVPFEVTLHEDDRRVITLHGTIDEIDVNGVNDWKTAGREYEDLWQYQRSAHQPTAYTLGAKSLGYFAGVDEVPFTFVVMPRDSDVPQYVTMTRHKGDWAFYAEQVKDLAISIEAQLPAWPKNDNQALCSPTWCGAWDACKGKHFSSLWPRPSEPKETLEQMALIAPDSGSVIEPTKGVTE